MGTLPDPLVMNSGKPVISKLQWETERRQELLEMFSREMYGRAPAKPKTLAFFLLEQDVKALGGIATRKQIKVSFDGTQDGPGFELLVYLPNAPKEKHPVILGINFWGNHSINSDPAIHLNTNWIEGGKNSFIDLTCVTNNQATEACRGGNARQWPLERFIDRGYGLATFYRGDIAPDFAHSLTNGIHALYPELQQGADNFGVIAAWAWALSRAMDYLETDRVVNPHQVVLFGWSRLGKAALWAGANDTRFAVVLSNESGAGGAKLFHRGVGENIKRLNTVFPHWYAKNFGKYNDQDTTLPFDQHELIALIAPRPVYIGSAFDDKGADAEGEFTAAREADKVYRFLGTDGLPTNRWPATNVSVQGQIGYHVRAGGHDVLDYDWTQYLAFADKHLKRSQTTLSPTSKTAFAHPGMMHSDAEFQFIRDKIQKGE
ncbi:MAG: acetylxylan esterase [Verrucomicrobiales bacterium]|nr:acetylxylan esterase [Verrucomicrobiales bacterium]